jgi:hypothetical protein
MVLVSCDPTIYGHPMLEAGVAVKLKINPMLSKKKKGDCNLCHSNWNVDNYSEPCH